MADKLPQKPKGEMTLTEYVAHLRNQIVISYDGAKEIALKNYDDISKRFAESHNALIASKEVKDKPIVEAKPEKDKSRNKKK